MQSPTQSNTYRLLDEKLAPDTSLAAFVAERRPQTGYERIARELETKTGVYVSWATLQRWFPKTAEKSA